MIFTRGDAHKFYKKVRKTYMEKQPIEKLNEIQEMEDIKAFYEKLPTNMLVLIKYRMEKENNGSGILPLLVSSLPWLLFIFSKQIQTFVFQDNTYYLLWAFVLAYSLFIIVSIVIHYREKAWAIVHIRILEDLLYRREQS